MLNASRDPDRFCRERHRRSLEPDETGKARRRIKDFLSENSFITAVKLNTEGWELALATSMYSNVFSPDAIHLATAWQVDADILLTNDRQFLREGKRVLETGRLVKDTRLCSVDKLPALLREMGVDA